MAKLKDLKLNEDLPAGGATINDSTESTETVYSSEKVVSLIPTDISDLTDTEGLLNQLSSGTGNSYTSSGW